MAKIRTVGELRTALAAVPDSAYITVTPDDFLVYRYGEMTKEQEAYIEGIEFQDKGTGIPHAYIYVPGA